MMAFQHDREAMVAASKAIHLEEWCSERDRCSGTSASSDAHARAALIALDKLLEQRLAGRGDAET